MNCCCNIRQRDRALFLLLHHHEPGLAVGGRRWDTRGTFPVAGGPSLFFSAAAPGAAREQQVPGISSFETDAASAAGEWRPKRANKGRWAKSHRNSTKQDGRQKSQPDSRYHHNLSTDTIQRRYDVVVRQLNPQSSSQSASAYAMSNPDGP